MTNKLYVNELLPSDTYALLTGTRTIAKDLCYKYTCVKAGRIAVWRAEDQPIIVISSLDDLEKLVQAIRALLRHDCIIWHN